MTAKMKSTNPQNQKYFVLTRLFKVLGYLLCAVSIGFAVMTKFVWTGIFAVGFLACSFLESHFEKKQPGFIPEEFLEGPEK